MTGGRVVGLLGCSGPVVGLIGIGMVLGATGVSGVIVEVGTVVGVWGCCGVGMTGIVVGFGFWAGPELTPETGGSVVGAVVGGLSPLMVETGSGSGSG
jgi:hypothetical protein